MTLALAVLGSGCAFTDATLPVDYDEAHASRGPISTLKDNGFKVEAFADDRQDKIRIGFKRNGYGQKTADIFTQDPVEKIVSDAVTEALEHNRQTVGPEGSILVKGDVKRFWFEVDPNFFTVKFMGTVTCDISFTDKLSNELIYQKEYVGNYEKETGGGLEATWTEVMSLSLENMIDSMIKDPRLVAALKANATKATATSSAGEY